MFHPQKVSLRRRLLKAAGVVVLNLIFWVVIPYYIGVYLSSRVPSSPLTVPTFIYEFGFLMTALQVGAALTEGMALSVPFISATYIVGALYLWLATNGGDLVFEASGMNFALGFRLIIIILIIPSIWGAIRAPLSYGIYRRSARAPPVPVVSAPA